MSLQNFKKTDINCAYIRHVQFNMSINSHKLFFTVQFLKT